MSAATAAAFCAKPLFARLSTSTRSGAADRRPRCATTRPAGLVRRSAASSDSGGNTEDAATVELYGSPGSRSPLIDWMLFECGVEFTPRAPSDPANPHPFGQIPALRDSTDDAENPLV